jgi:hypothetical protein
LEAYINQKFEQLPPVQWLDTEWIISEEVSKDEIWGRDFDEVWHRILVRAAVSLTIEQIGDNQLDQKIDVRKMQKIVIAAELAADVAKGLLFECIDKKASLDGDKPNDAGIGPS